MARPKKGSKESPVPAGELEAAAESLLPTRSFKIVEGSLNDEYCHYTYEITSGIGIHNKPKVPGKHVVLEDMVNAFTGFNVHLACLDSAFKIADVEIIGINQIKDHEIVQCYRVSGFKIKGSGDNESVSLIGTKYSSVAQGWFNLATPYIPLDKLSFYQWYNELKEVTDSVREEVALYHEGKYVPDEVQEEERAVQLSIVSPEAAAERPEGSSEELQDEFSEAER